MQDVPEGLGRGAAEIAIGLITAAGVGGAMFRIRGSAAFERWVGRGATTARIMAWALPMAMVTLGGIGHGWDFPIMAFAYWLGAIAPWFQSLSLGRVPEEKMQVLPSFLARRWPSLAAFLVEDSWRRDAVMHAIRGMIWVLPPTIALVYTGGCWWAMLLAGLVCLPAYEIGWRVSPRRGTEIGEVLFGAVVGAAAALS